MSFSLGARLSRLTLSRRLDQQSRCQRNRFLESNASRRRLPADGPGRISPLARAFCPAQRLTPNVILAAAKGLFYLGRMNDAVALPPLSRPARSILIPKPLEGFVLGIFPFDDLADLFPGPCSDRLRIPQKMFRYADLHPLSHMLSPVLAFPHKRREHVLLCQLSIRHRTCECHPSRGHSEQIRRFPIVEPEGRPISRSVTDASRKASGRLPSAHA